MNVYVIASEGGMCKIGKANDPARRMAALSTGHPHKLTVAHVFEMESDAAAYDVESRAHYRLATKRMQGEWFQVTAEEARDAIAAVVSPPSAPITPSWWQTQCLEKAMSQIAIANMAVATGLVTKKYDPPAIQRAAEALDAAVVALAELAAPLQPGEDDDI